MNKKVCYTELFLDACKENDIEKFNKYITCVELDKIGKLALLNAIEHKNVDIVKILIENKVDINFGNEYPLILAIYLGDLPTVKLLIESGADYKINNYYPYILAVEKGYTELVKYFISLDVPLSVYENKALKVAIKNGDFVTCTLLLNSKKVDLNLDTETLLFTAAQGGFLNILVLLLNNIKNIDNDILTKCLVFGINSGKIEVVKELVKRGAKLEEDINFLIKHAMNLGYIDIVKYIINTTNISVIDDDVICNAIYYGDIDLIDYLIKKGANIKANNNKPFRIAVLCNKVDIVKYILGIVGGIENNLDLKEILKEYNKEEYINDNNVLEK